MKAIHSYNTFITFEETDASGRIYFSNIFKVAHRAMEDFALKNNVYEQWFTNSEWATPVRHSEADFKKELRSGSKVQIDMFVDKIGNTSFKIRFEISSEGEPAATVNVTHVAVDTQSKSPRPVPEELLKIFQ